MNVAVSLEQRFFRTPDGCVWTPASFAYSFWTRYLTVFDGVKVVGRVSDVRDPAPKWKRVDGAGVSLLPIPNYEGVLQYSLRAITVQRAARRAVRGNDAILMRVASQIANILEPELRGTGRPYGVEVVGDPYEGFRPGAVQHPIRPWLRWWLTRRLQTQCREACGVAYVTERHLQARYPSRTHSSEGETSPVLTTHYSSIDLQPDHFVTAPRSFRNSGSSLTITTVASLASATKGIDVLLKAIGLLSNQGFEVRLNVVGDGRCRPNLERLADTLGITNRVTFVGQIPAGAEVFQQLDSADMFVLPSWSEGLPRAVIEAMSRGLPCVCSGVAGILELLPSEDLVPPGDPQALAAKIAEVARDSDRMAAMSTRNLTKASEYREEILQERRTRLYRHLRTQTELWFRGRR